MENEKLGWILFWPTTTSVFLISFFLTENVIRQRVNKLEHGKIYVKYIMEITLNFFSHLPKKSEDIKVFQKPLISKKFLWPDWLRGAAFWKPCVTSVILVYSQYLYQNITTNHAISSTNPLIFRVEELQD